MKMGGGDGDEAAAKPGFSSEGNPYQKPKTQRIWPTILLKMGGLSPALSKMGGRVPPSSPVAEPLGGVIRPPPPGTQGCASSPGGDGLRCGPALKTRSLAGVHI